MHGGQLEAEGRELFPIIFRAGRRASDPLPHIWEMATPCGSRPGGMDIPRWQLGLPGHGLFCPSPAATRHNLLATMVLVTRCMRLADWCSSWIGCSPLPEGWLLAQKGQLDERFPLCRNCSKRGEYQGGSTPGVQMTSRLQQESFLAHSPALVLAGAVPHGWFGVGMPWLSCCGLDIHRAGRNGSLLRICGGKGWRTGRWFSAS